MSELGEADSNILRTCRDCGHVGPLSDFHTASRRKYGRGSYCQLCYNERSKKSYRTRMLEKHGREVRTPLKAPDGFRRCPDCDTVKPLEEFPLNRSKPSGYERYCLPCHNIRCRANKIKKQGSTRQYHLKRRYKIGQAEFDVMLAAQDGKCRICGVPDPKHVDHDHLTGRVRGILCFNCNGGLGHFRDDVITMQRAITYLKETSCQRVLVHPGVYRLLSPRRVSLPSRSS
jgi:Recombination endonuclease VII